MASASKTLLRQYARLPVWIEEDHHEVVPHIHRAIASRHLPMAGIPMVHFDSHPDLLLPLHLQADDVFDKDKLYSELSIENWILPLVYAGHINEIYWLKPPWADQLHDASHLSFSVGKWTETGEIRMTLDDPYFLTEALYAPESQLTNIKRATLHIITIRPDKWSSDSDSAGSPSLSSEELSQSHGIAQQSLIHSTRTHRNSESSGSSTKVDEKLDGVCEDNELGKRRHCLSNIEAQEKSTDDVKQMCRDPTPIRSKIRKVEGKGDAFDDTTGQRKTDSSGEATGMVLPNRTPTAAGAGSSSFTDQRWLVELQEKLEGRPYILDIDLDFYSTKDPFQNECSPGLTTLLQQLFQFNLPAEKSEKSVLAFSQARQAQLDELYTVFQQLHKQPDSTPLVRDPHRQMVLDKLIHLLHSDDSQQPPMDFEMLYRAGCTFDGTELPHHVSSPQQIQQLMEASSSLLKALPAPKLITVARSSIDDYCPQDQVEAIQEAMMEVLTDVYKEIDVSKLYEQQQ